MAPDSSSMTMTDPDAARRADPETRSVLRRIVSIVDAFDGSQRVLSLAELSNVTGLPKSTVHRYAEQLVELPPLLVAVTQNTSA